MAILSEPKRRLIEFIRDAKLDKEYQFEITGTVTDAKKFVHRMRVELTRFRNQVIAQGRTVKQFKVHHIKSEVIDGGKKVRITLVKSMNSACRASNDIDEVFNDIAGGEVVKI